MPAPWSRRPRVHDEVGRRSGVRRCGRRERSSGSCGFAGRFGPHPRWPAGICTRSTTTGSCRSSGSGPRGRSSRAGRSTRHPGLPRRRRRRDIFPQQRELVEIRQGMHHKAATGGRGFMRRRGSHDGGLDCDPAERADARHDPAARARRASRTGPWSARPWPRENRCSPAPWIAKTPG